MSRTTLTTAFCLTMVAACGLDQHAAPGVGSNAGQGVEDAHRVMSATPGNRMVELLQPAAPELYVRSEKEKQHGMEVGRELPVPELLQPTLDPTLPEFEQRLERTVAGNYVGGASDVLPGLVKAWIAGFNRIYPDVRIDVPPPYAGSLGMLEVIEGTYDFVFVSRELKPSDVTSFHDKYGYDPFTVPVSGASYRHYGFLDAVGFFVNIANPLSQLTFEQIDALYSTTRHRGGQPITTWGDLGLGGEWADRPVHLYGIQPWNGFEEFIRQRVLNFGGKRGEWREDINFSHEAFPIAEQVANDPLGIGYTGLAYITQPVRMLPLVAGERSDAHVPPTYERVADASYPLSRLIYFNTDKPLDRRLDPVLDEFLRFILSKEGQKIVLEQAIYLPLRSWQVAESRAALD